MRLYLSSELLGNETETLVRLVTNPSAAVIMNATDHLPQDRHGFYRDREIAALNTLGIAAEEVDLRAFFGAPQQLRAELSRFGLLWVTGGNTFLLRRAMRQSGFDQILGELLAEGVVYGGYSAGSCVAAPTLRGLEFYDDPEIIAAGYQRAAIWEGLDLVPYSIVPHYESAEPNSQFANDAIAFFQQHHLPYRALRDGEVIICSDPPPRGAD